MTNHHDMTTRTTTAKQQHHHHHTKWAIAAKLRVAALLVVGAHLLVVLLLQQDFFQDLMEQISSSSSSSAGGEEQHQEKTAATARTTAPTATATTTIDSSSSSSSSATTNATATITCRIEQNNLKKTSPDGGAVVWLLQNSSNKHDERHGNIAMSPEEFAEQYKLLSSPSLLHHIDSLMGQTLAWPESRLVQSKQDVMMMMIHHPDDDKPPTTAVSSSATAAWERRWLTRLSFAVIYLHQHGPAREQCKSATSSSSSLTAEDIESCKASGLPQRQQWDWECGPHQKYLLFSQQDQGLGAGVVLFRQAMMAGIASQRIVLPVNNVATFLNKNTKIRDAGNAWTMASCPRRDMQCVFAPTSPCVLTMEQIYNGTLLQTKQDFFRLFYKGTSPNTKAYMNDSNSTKVLWQSYNNFGLKDAKHNEVFFDRVYTLAQQLLAELSSLVKIHDDDDDDDDAKNHEATALAIWKRTAELYVTNRRLALECFHKAITMYLLRPNTLYHKRLREMLKSNIPSSSKRAQENNSGHTNDYDPQQTIGLPIRATDKCTRESSCLSFDQYMELALETWKQRNASALSSSSSPPNKESSSLSNPPYVIVTSEAKEIYQQLRQVMADPVKSARYPFRFIMNDNDVQPGTGRFRPLQKQGGGAGGDSNTTISTMITADDGMVSALSTLQLQLGSGVTRANCCSSFHKIMDEFLSVSGGGALENDFQCLNDQSTDPRFRICCWKGGSCMEKRDKDLEQWEKDNRSKESALKTSNMAS